jgi:hypothetical protein
MKAFPLSNEKNYGQDGMDLRDYFAAKAMQAMANAICKIDDLGIISHAPNDVAQISYVYADAMMKAREL